MRSALYYPHTSIRNENLIKTALLLWDNLEYIVPWRHFQSHHRIKTIARAMELIDSPHYRDEDEKQEAHTRLKELVSRRLPPQLYFNRKRKEEHFEIYPEKLLPDSWRLLEKLRVSSKLPRNSDYTLSEYGGLTVMSILADCCAGTTKSRITDRGEAYATVAGFLGNRVEAAKTKYIDAREQLVPITLKAINTSYTARGNEAPCTHMHTGKPLHDRSAHSRLRRVRRKPYPIVRRTLSYQRRLKAGGLSDDDWDSLGDFVRARLRAMWRNDWHGCPLPPCRRHRGSMAPYLYCANANAPPPAPPDPRAGDDGRSSAATAP